MSDLYKESIPHNKDLKLCPECGAEIIQDIFQLPKEMATKKGRLIEARACDDCKIIYHILDQ
jgi:hypothetical protein